MPDTPSEWCVVAACSSCGDPFSTTAVAVFVRETMLGPRGVVLDVLGERWPEPGHLFHPRCYAQRSGRAALWVSFLRGRFDKGVPRDRKTRRAALGKTVASTDRAAWELRVSCCVCAVQLGAADAAVVRDRRTRQRWLWVPVLQLRRPGQRQVVHLQCFVKTHGRRAAYAALGRDTWDRLGPVVKNIGQAISPGPF